MSQARIVGSDSPKVHLLFFLTEVTQLFIESIYKYTVPILFPNRNWHSVHLNWGLLQTALSQVQKNSSNFALSQIEIFSGLSSTSCLVEHYAVTNSIKDQSSWVLRYCHTMQAPPGGPNNHNSMNSIHLDGREKRLASNHNSTRQLLKYNTSIAQNNSFWV